MQNDKDEFVETLDTADLNRLLKIAKHLESSRKVNYLLILELDNKEPVVTTK